MQASDFQWFLEHYSDLHDKYGDSYLAIKNKTVLGSYSSYADAVSSTSKVEQIGTFIVQFCNGVESAYTSHIASFGISF